MAFQLYLRDMPLPPDVPASVDPLDALARLAEASSGDLVLLHSGSDGGFSVLGFEPLCQLTVDADGVSHWRMPEGLPVPELAGGCKPLDALERLVDSFSFDAPHPLVGWLGFLSYDLAHTLERIRRVASDALHWPLLSFALYRHYLLFDHQAGVCAAYSYNTKSSDLVDPFAALRNPRPAITAYAPEAKLIERPSRAGYLEKVERVRAYIAAGDIYQANLAQRWIVQTSESPHAIFRRLCGISPARYSAFLRLTDSTGITRHVISASPELFLSIDKGHAITRPIKGTRPRDPADPARDMSLRDELLASPKDRAELTMIVDLLRNDLGRVSRYGTVQVTEPRGIEQHPTVWHTVATIESDLRAHVSLSELIAAMCPGGSITGAPKIRATQIIEELEGFRRGLYCGHIGVIGPREASGGTPPMLALNIAIRTILHQEGHAHIFAGGGIIADSDPAQEYLETLHKAAALFRALAIDPATLQ